MTLILGCGTTLRAQLPHPPAPVLGVHPATPFPDEQPSGRISAGNRSQSKATSEALRKAEKYLKGKGTPVDLAQAAYWYRIAADEGNPTAQNMLGYFYLEGIAVKKDEAEALRWFTRGCGGGSRWAKLNLAVMYMKGMGVRSDPGLAIDLFGQLAEAGTPRAQAYLGIIYYDGIGVAPDHGTAEKWFSKAAKAKDPEGEYAMGRFYATEPNHKRDYKRAARYFRHSADRGLVMAMHELAVLLLEHPEIPQRSSDEATGLLHRSAEAGAWRSSDVLGILARDGVGRPANAAEAFRWFTIAAKQGGRDAQSRVEGQLTMCRGELSQDEQDRQSGIAELWYRQHPRQGAFAGNSAGLTQALLGDANLGQMGSAAADTE